jgi:hypothetical protein
MDMQRLKFFPMMAVALLAACASPPPKADYGSYPNEYENDAKERISSMLRDPESARFVFGEPVKAWGNNGLIQGGNVTFIGYVIPIAVNARNGFGGYTGFQEWFCTYQYGVIGTCNYGSYKSNVLVHVVN